jgi:hypothetical protein
VSSIRATLYLSLAARFPAHIMVRSLCHGSDDGRIAVACHCRLQHLGARHCV